MATMLKAKSHIGTKNTLHADDGSEVVSIAEAVRLLGIPRIKIVYAIGRGDLAVYTAAGAMVFVKVRDLKWWHESKSLKGVW